MTLLPKLDILTLKPAAKPKANKPTKSRGLAGWFLAVFILSAAAGAGITSYVLWDKLSRIEIAMKDMFYEFCVVRSAKNLNDAKAQKVCKDVFDGAISAGVSPFRFTQIVGHESGFNCGVVSPTGDYGCAQINIASWGRTPFGCDIVEPRCNIYTGAMIYKAALDRFGDERLALTAYNKGISAVSAGARTDYPEKVLRI